MNIFVCLCVSRLFRICGPKTTTVALPPPSLPKKTHSKIPGLVHTVWNLAAPLSVETAQNPKIAEQVTVNGMRNVPEMRWEEVWSWVFQGKIWVSEGHFLSFRWGRSLGVKLLFLDKFVHIYTVDECRKWRFWSYFWLVLVERVVGQHENCISPWEMFAHHWRLHSRPWVFAVHESLSQCHAQFKSIRSGSRTTPSLIEHARTF